MPRFFSFWLILFALSSTALAQAPTGHTVAVVPDASAFNSSGVRLLSAQQAVFMGDRLQTGPVGEAQLQFIDETRLVVGPGASLVIDSFVVKEDTVRNFALSAARGTFRFFSGTSPKSAYAISTPTVTLGVRGTQFDFTVLPDGETEFVLLHGEVRICDRFGNCIVAGRPCTLISAPVDGPLRLLPTFERKPRLEDNFPYVTSQESRLVPAFQTDVSRCGVYAEGPGTPIHIGFDDAYKGARTADTNKGGGGFGIGSLDLSGFNILFPAGLASTPSVASQQALVSAGEAGSRPGIIDPSEPDSRPPSGPGPPGRPRHSPELPEPLAPFPLPLSPFGPSPLPLFPLLPDSLALPEPPPPVPLPGALPLFASVLGVSGWLGYRRKRAQRQAAAVA